MAKEKLSRLEVFMRNLIIVATCWFALAGQVWAAVTPEQRRQITDLESELSIAGRHYNNSKFDEAATKIGSAQKILMQLLTSKDPAVLKAVKPLYSRLEKAHALLELEGAELEALPTWDALTTDSPKPTESLSFKNDIVPILVANCGGCHVTNRRGQFSMATFKDLMEGVKGRKVVSPGGGKGSRIVEVIESGTMPPNGNKVPEADVAKLQKWIDEGAKFDGPDPATPLNTYGTGNMPAQPQESDQVAKPTGKETVKFSTDVAPLLVEHCNGCHINGRRPSGGFNMTNFAAMRRGGDGGKAWVAGKPDDSLIIKKLRGQSGQRMPLNRPALPEEKISLISTWIKEGATYDNVNPSLSIENVISQAWAAAASHSDLLARRTERAKDLWKKVLPTSEPTIAGNDELVVLGNVTQGRADEWLAAGQTALADVRKQLRLPSGNLVKGGVTIFVYKGRYDYSEFGRMNENRKLPQNWQGHWRASPLDVYVALVDDTKLEAKQQIALLVQHLSGAYAGSLPQVPDWFAEGVARNVAISTAPRGDARIETWKRMLPAAAAMVDKSETLLEGRLDDEASGLVGMKLVGVMMDRRNRKQFDALMNLMREGKPFPDALTQTFTSPEKFIKSWVGK